MGTVKNHFSIEASTAPAAWSGGWPLIASDARFIQSRRRTKAMVKKLLAAALALSAFAAFACVPITASTPRKTEVTDSHEFDDLTVERNPMHEHTFSRECDVNSTNGIYEGTQLKARLA